LATFASLFRPARCIWRVVRARFSPAAQSSPKSNHKRRYKPGVAVTDAKCKSPHDLKKDADCLDKITPENNVIEILSEHKAMAA
jgi:hypothetical protein